MAAFKQHIMFSTALGIGYTAALKGLGVDLTHGCLAGALCGVSGMLPDLDSDSGKPIQEIFGVTAAMTPLLLLPRFQSAALSTEETILFMGLLYLFIRFGLSWLFKRLTVHRGMFHSLPAAIIAAEIVYLVHDCHEPHGQLVLAFGVLLGFTSHLVLDEIYSVDFNGLGVRLKSSAGSALKFKSESIPATLMAWAMLGFLSYLVAIKDGYVQPPDISSKSLPMLRLPSRR